MFQAHGGLIEIKEIIGGGGKLGWALAERLRPLARSPIRTFAPL
jgi:hypothetical protein